jgi:hypothetical protein
MTTRPPARTGPTRPANARRFVDAEPARVHLRYLSQHGIGFRAVAEHVGTSRSTIERIAGIGAGKRRPSRAVTRHTAAAILAIQPGIDTARDGAFVDPAGSTRRLQALVALGFPGRFLAARLGADPKWLPIYRIPEHVRAVSARAIRDLYDELSMRSPAEFPEIDLRGSTRARNHARALGWPRPLELDDDLIDDPSATAQRVERVEERGRTVTDDEIEDAMWIIRTTGADMSHEHERAVVADRLGVAIHRLEYILAKVAGRVQLAAAA